MRVKLIGVSTVPRKSECVANGAEPILFAPIEEEPDLSSAWRHVGHHDNLYFTGCDDFTLAKIRDKIFDWALL
jgi:hypothetical protein